MKKIPFATILTISTILSACGGGGGGHGHIPSTTLPDNPDVTCNGVTCMTNEGMSNKTKREELYNNALNTSGISLFSPIGPSKEDIDGAYQEMKTQLVDTSIDENNAEALRPYLILAGFEDLPEDEASLKDWISNRKYMIKSHAEKAYNMYGTEQSVYLDNAKFHLVEETANQDTFINFTIDENKNINGIEVSNNDFSSEAYKDKLSLSNQNNFSGSRNTLHKYTYDYNGRKLEVFFSEDTEGQKPELNALKEKLKLKLTEKLEELALDTSETGKNVYEYYNSVKDDMINNIDKLDNSSASNMEEVIERTINTTYTSYAKNLKNGNGNLLYSDFGLIGWNEQRNNINLPEGDEDKYETLVATKVFAGGYDAMKINPDKSQNMHFEGDAVGGVNYKQIVAGDETIKASDTLKLEGKASLDFANGKEHLSANFNNWYDVDVTKDLDSGKGSISFSGGDGVDNKFKFQGQDNYKNDDFIKETYNAATSEGTAGAMDIGYYGKDGVPSEATGYVMYHEEVKNKQDNALLDVLEVQMGVGMQKK